MHKLETRYLFYGSKVNLGSFGVIGVKFWFSLKMHYLFYVTKYIHVIHTLASHLQNKQGNWGQSGVDVSQPAGYAVCDGNMSSFFFFLSCRRSRRILFFFLSHNLLLLPHAWSDFDQTWSEWPVGEWLQKLCFVWPQRSGKGHRGQKGHFYAKCISSYKLYWILTKLGQKHQWVSGYISYALFDLKGHVEVTGVKEVISFSKCSDWAEILIQWSLWHSKHPKNILKFYRGH